MTQVFVSVQDSNWQDVKWIDARYSLQDKEQGRREFDEKHVDGAVYWDLEKDLSDMAKTGGAHPMPEQKQLTELFQRSGLQLDDMIYVYDNGGNPFATRAWWMLQYAGFKHAYIVLEGFDQLESLGIPVSDEETQPVRSNVQPDWQEDLYVSRDEAAQISEGKQGGTLLDARSAVRYRGEQEPLYPIAGRIPGAKNMFWEKLLKDGQFQFDEELRNEIKQVVHPDEDITVYCGSGVTATPVYAALKEVGYPNVHVYIGSYSDWISQQDAPVEKG